jgi:hypothetical protein
MATLGTRPIDTTPDAHDVQTEIYRRLGGAERVAIQFRLTAMVRDLATAGIRARHPQYDDQQVLLAYARLTLGDALTQAAWPGRELVEP